MKSKTKGIVRWLASGCFIVSAIANIPYIIRLLGLTGFVGSKSGALLMILDSIGKALMALAIVTSAFGVAIAGSVGNLLSLIIRGIRCNFTIHAGFVDARFWTSGLLGIVFWALIAISALPVLNKKYARISCFAAGLVELLHFVVIVPEQAAMIKEYGLSVARVCDILPVILLAVGAILLGMAFPEMQEQTKKKDIPVKQMQTGPENKLEQLEKLNALLEKGYVTKEEFDAKKEQIVNSSV